MPEFPYRVERTVLIKAKPETVFRFFTDSARWANWWGAGSTIDAAPGGRVYIRHMNGTESVGEVLEVRAPEQIVFSYGFASGKPIPPGASRVTIQLNPDQSGTRLYLKHEFADAAVCEEHVQGWRFQLSLFSNAVTNEVFASAVDLVEEWFAVQMEPDERQRVARLSKIVTPDIRFFDQYSLLQGVPDLSAHIGAAQRFMPGIGLRRKGDVRHCQGSVLADWASFNHEGKELMSGTSAFILNAEVKIDWVTGFTNPRPA